MEDAFFSHPLNHDRRPYFPAPMPRRAAAGKPRLVSIPVHFIGSEGKTVAEEKKPPSDSWWSAAAARIQRVFRGFLARKNVKAVRTLAAEAEEMERRVAEDEELLRREERARLWTNEMLMRLLLKLDSVKGARGFRRNVIRRVIALQERVDAIAAETTEEVGQEETNTAPLKDTKGEEAAEGSKAPPKEQTLEASRGEDLREVKGMVVAESERLRAMVTELCDLGAQQCRLMVGLAECVERLERAVHRMERSKKERRAGSALDNDCNPKKQ